MLILSAFKDGAIRADITRSIKHARKSVSQFLSEARPSLLGSARSPSLKNDYSFPKRFVISTQFRERRSTRFAGALSRLKIYEVPLMKFPTSLFFDIQREGQWTPRQNDVGRSGEGVWKCTETMSTFRWK